MIEKLFILKWIFIINKIYNEEMANLKSNAEVFGMLFSYKFSLLKTKMLQDMYWQLSPAPF